VRGVAVARKYVSDEAVKDDRGHNYLPLPLSFPRL